MLGTLRPLRFPRWMGSAGPGGRRRPLRSPGARLPARINRLRPHDLKPVLGGQQKPCGHLRGRVEDWILLAMSGPAGDDFLIGLLLAPEPLSWDSDQLDCSEHGGEQERP